MRTSTTTIRVLALPIADRGTASARLRLHDLVPHLPARFDTTVARPGVDRALAAHNPEEFDLVYVQKDARPEVVALSRRAVAAGIPVVYDIDDDFGTWPDMDEETMCQVATTVTVDSRGRAKAVRGLTKTDPDVLPCMIDLAGDPGRQRRHRATDGVSTVASFGNLVSLRNTLDYLAAVPAHMATYVIGPDDAAPELPGQELVPFDLDTFVTDLQRADVFVLAHGEKEAPLKDNNRLIMAMSLGIPVLVSPSPAYLDVLEALELEWLACSTNDIGNRLERLDDPAIRAEIGRVSLAYAWANFRPQRCGQILAETFDRTLERAGERAS